MILSTKRLVNRLIQPLIRPPEPNILQLGDGYWPSMAYQIRKIWTGEAFSRREHGRPALLVVPQERVVTEATFEELEAVFRWRQWDIDLLVEAAEEGRVEIPGGVGGADYDGVRSCVGHLAEKFCLQAGGGRMFWVHRQVREFCYYFWCCLNWAIWLLRCIFIRGLMVLNYFTYCLLQKNSNSLDNSFLKQLISFSCLNRIDCFNQRNSYLSSAWNDDRMFYMDRHPIFQWDWCF